MERLMHVAFQLRLAPRAPADRARLGYNAWMSASGPGRAGWTWIVALIAVGCGSAAAPVQGPSTHAPQRVAPVPVPVDEAIRGCQEAAVGLERGTRSLRPPEGSVLETGRRLCVDDAWPAATIECFARMDEGDFGRCAAALPKQARQRLFDRVGGGASDRIAVASALVKLSALQLGIAECDRFVEVVAHVLVCDAMAIEVRAQLASETVDFWSLPTSGLPADAQLRMAEVCGKSTVALEQHAVGAGCAP